MNKTIKTLPKLLAASALSVSSMMTFAHVDKMPSPTVNNTAESSQVSALVADDKKTLMGKLARLDFFNASFTQKIFSDSGDLLQQGKGKLAISKPNLVNWQTTEPDETFIISDGDTLWFYDPFIEQATAYNLAQSIHNTPILLLTSNDEALWQQYSVQQSADNFVITPLTQNSQIKSLTINFAADKPQEQLSEFSFVDATGQISTIILADFDAVTPPDKSLFDFNLPQGVRLEDKR